MDTPHVVAADVRLASHDLSFGDTMDPESSQIFVGRGSARAYWGILRWHGGTPRVELPDMYGGVRADVLFHLAAEAARRAGVSAAGSEALLIAAGVKAGVRADAIGCAHSTQGGGMPPLPDVERGLAREAAALAGLSGEAWHKALGELAAHALFASICFSPKSKKAHVEQPPVAPRSPRERFAPHDVDHLRRLRIQIDSEIARRTGEAAPVEEIEPDVERAALHAELAEVRAELEIARAFPERAVDMLCSMASEIEAGVYARDAAAKRELENARAELIAAYPTRLGVTKLDRDDREIDGGSYSLSPEESAPVRAGEHRCRAARGSLAETTKDLRDPEHKAICLRQAADLVREIAPKPRPAVVPQSDLRLPLVGEMLVLVAAMLESPVAMSRARDAANCRNVDDLDERRPALIAAAALAICQRLALDRLHSTVNYRPEAAAIADPVTFAKQLAFEAGGFSSSFVGIMVKDIRNRIEALAERQEKGPNT